GSDAPLPRGLVVRLRPPVGRPTPAGRSALHPFEVPGTRDLPDLRRGARPRGPDLALLQLRQPEWTGPGADGRLRVLDLLGGRRSSDAPGAARAVVPPSARGHAHRRRSTPREVPERQGHRVAEVAAPRPPRVALAA